MDQVVDRYSRPGLRVLHAENSFCPSEQGDRGGLPGQHFPYERVGQYGPIYRFVPVCRLVVVFRFDPHPRHGEAFRLDQLPQRVVAFPLDQLEAVFPLDLTC